VKLDFPYKFADYPDPSEGERLKDPLLKNKVVSPDVLAGVAKIIIARAPYLIQTRHIFNRKSTDLQEAEYKRQQFHLNGFCEDCLSLTWPFPEDKTPRLEVGRAYAEYEAYCKLFNVTEKASKIAFGRYIAQMFGVDSLVDEVHCEKSSNLITWDLYQKNLLNLLNPLDDSDSSVDYVAKEKVREIRVLTSLKSTNEEFRSLCKDLIRQEKESSITLAIKIMDKSSYNAIHDRYIFTKNHIFNVPSPDIIKRGQFSNVTEVEDTLPFEEWWENGLDLILDWNKIEQIF
jgi:hypothetical protein